MYTEIEALRVVAKKARTLSNRMADYQGDPEIDRAVKGLEQALEDLDTALIRGVHMREAENGSMYANKCVTDIDGQKLECNQPSGHPGTHTWQCGVLTPWGFGGLDPCLKASGHAGSHSTDTRELGHNK